MKVISRLVRVHAASTSLRGELTSVLLGIGLVPLKEMLATLGNAGFDAWICVEETSFTEPLGGRVDFMRRVWNESAHP